MVDIKKLTKEDIENNIDELIYDDQFVSHIDDFLLQAVDDLDYKLLHLLLENGANPDIKDWSGVDSLLHSLAHQYGTERELKGKKIVSVAKMLLDYGASPNVAGYNNLTPIQICKSVKAKDFIDLLLKYGADPEGNIPI